MPYDTGLAARIRSALAPRPTRERAMFGGLSFMVAEKLIVAARGDSSLLVRVDSARADELLEIEGAEPAEMKNRAMGRGWMTVRGESLATDERLEFWLGVALESIGAQVR